MDGKGAWRGNAFIERFWWSLKCENVYLHANEDVRAAQMGIGSCIEYYNRERQHSSLDTLTPVEAYEQNLQVAAASAPPPAGLATGPDPLRSWLRLGTRET